LYSQNLVSITQALEREPASYVQKEDLNAIPPPPFVASLATGENGVVFGAGSSGQALYRQIVERRPSPATILDPFPEDARISLRSGVNPALTLAVVTDGQG
jgi:hypothetical protein